MGPRHCAPFLLMAYGNEFLKRLEALDIMKNVEQISAEEEARFKEAQQLQLVKGQDRNGDWLPKYTDDMEYFKGDMEKAIAYRDWKIDISLDKEKPIDVMDFWIDGTLNSRVDARISGGKVDLKINDSKEASVLRKTNGKALGINPGSAAKLWNTYLHPPLLRRISEQTGIK